MKRRIDESLINEIVKRILSVALPDKIILFGSAVSGNISNDSDIDLLVVEKNPQNYWKEINKIEAILGDLDYIFDVKVISSGWFELTKHVVGGIAYPANRNGKIIYEAA